MQVYPLTFQKLNLPQKVCFKGKIPKNLKLPREKVWWIKKTIRLKTNTRKPTKNGKVVLLMALPCLHLRKT